MLEDMWCLACWRACGVLDASLHLFLGASGCCMCFHPALITMLLVFAVLVFNDVIVVHDRSG